MKKSFQRRRSGQIAVVLAVMLLALVLLALMNVDTFLAFRGKARMGNAGDAAAIAAAHWQGLTLNLIGELNLARLDAICQHAEKPDVANAISSGIYALQHRLAFAGPTMALFAASNAAGLNHAGIDTNMTDILDQSIALAMQITPDGTSSWPHQWKEYAGMLREARGDGLRAGCDNANLFDLFSDFSDGHMLHHKPFYEAVAGEDWCWFFLRDNMYSLLKSFQSWSPIGEPRELDCDNPEYFALGLQSGNIDPAESKSTLLGVADAYGLRHVTEDALDKLEVAKANDVPWMLYNLGNWRVWSEMDPNGHNRLPILSEPKDEYNVLGATAAVRTGTSIPMFTPSIHAKARGLKDLDSGRFTSEETLEAEKESFLGSMVERWESVGWTAAAKPFGYRDATGFREPVTHFGGTMFPLVTPDFRAVRLIPLAGASGGNLSTGDADWVRHMRTHVPAYSQTGQTERGCQWCSALVKWSNPSFRRKGMEWLLENSDVCLVKGSGTSASGGTRHAH